MSNSNDLKEISTACLQAMLSSDHVSEFASAGRGLSNERDTYDALANEAFYYAKALIQKLNEEQNNH